MYGKMAPIYQEIQAEEAATQDYKKCCNNEQNKSIFKIPLSLMIVFSSFAINLKTMITWWAWTTFIIIVFHVSRFNSIESLLNAVHHTAITHPPDRTTLVIIFVLFFPLSTLVNSLLTCPGSCGQEPLIPVFLICDFSK